MRPETREQLIKTLAQAISSTVGCTDPSPTLLGTPRDWLERDLARILVIIDGLAKSGDISLERIADYRLAEKPELHALLGAVGSTQIRLLFKPQTRRKNGKETTDN